MLALLALLFSSGPKSTNQLNTAVSSASVALFDDLPAEFEQFAARLEGQRGYALSERLDELSTSANYHEALASVLANFDAEELARAAVEFESSFENFRMRIKDRQLLPLISRTYGALVATFELMSPELFEEARIGIDKGIEHGVRAISIDALDLSARERRYLRECLRGGVALTCLPLIDDEVSRAQLLAHAATGMETNLRLVAAVSSERERAQNLLAQLRLEPIDLGALARRREALADARASLDEAREQVPGFRLPSDPSVEF